MDTPSLDTKGTADSFFGFLWLADDRRGAPRKSAARRDESHEMNKAFLKIFGYMMIGMFVLRDHVSGRYGLLEPDQEDDVQPSQQRRDDDP